MLRQLKLRLASAGFVVAAAVLAAIVAFQPAAAQDLKKVRVGVLRLASSGNVFIAVDRGYFKKAGLDVELKFFDAAQPVAVAAAAGDIDFGVTAFTGGLFNLAGKGAIGIIAGQSREQPGFPLIAYLASAHAPAAASIKAPKDIAGHSVGVTQVGSSFHYSVGLLADKYGFPLSKVKIVPLQSLSNVASALKGGRTDAALLPATSAQPLIDAGDARLLGWVGDETPWQLGAVFAPKAKLNDAKLVHAFLEAYDEGCRDYHDILLASVKDGKAQANDKTNPLLDIIAHYTKQPVSRIVGGLAYIDPKGDLEVKSVAKQLAWFQNEGFADKGFKIGDIIDKRYVKE